MANPKWAYAPSGQTENSRGNQSTSRDAPCLAAHGRFTARSHMNANCACNDRHAHSSLIAFFFAGCVYCRADTSFPNPHVCAFVLLRYSHIVRGMPDITHHCSLPQSGL